MSPHSAIIKLAVLWLLLACTASAAKAAGTAGPRAGSTQQQRGMLMRWFNKMDVDRDGELQAGELRDFIGAQLGTADFTTGRQLDHAIEQVTGKLDGADSGLDISVSELDQHLNKVLEGVKVWEWVTHSLGLPMYAGAFKSNAITVHDFPMLLNDGGQLLQAELMVISLLHRQKIMRAMQRQMLGLGAEPGPIKHLSCSNSSNSIAGAQPLSARSHIVQCIWQPPRIPGEPPLHKYVLERFAFAPPSPAAAWQPVVELDDLVVTRFSDAVAEPGSYRYRVAAWSLYGRSAYAFSNEVVVEGLLGGSAAALGREAAAAAAAVGKVPAAVPAVAATHQQQRRQQPQQAPQKQQQQDLQAQHVIIQAGEVAGLKHEMNSAAVEGGIALPGQHADEQQQQQPQLLLRPPAHLALLIGDHSRQQQQQHQLAAAAGHQLLQDVAYAVVPMDHHHQQLQEQSLNDQQQQHQQRQSSADALPNGLVRHISVCGSDSSACQDGTSSSCMPGDSTASACTDGCGPAAVGCSSNSLVVPNSCAAGEAAAAAGSPAGSNVVWVIGDRSSLVGNSPSSSPAAIVAQAQLLASMQAAAGAAAGVGSQQGQGSSSNRGSAAGTAGKAAAAGSWSIAAVIASQLGRWLQALLNSLLLLVVPVCVRLLPVPVLHQLALGLARLLQLLPQPVRHVLQQLGATATSSREAEHVPQHAVGVDAASSLLDGVGPGSRAFKASTSGSSNGSSSRTRTFSSTGAAAADAAGIPSVPAAASDAAAIDLPLHLAAEQGEQQLLQAAGMVLIGDVGLSSHGGSPGTAAAAAAGGGGALKKSSSQLGLLLRSLPSSPGSSAAALPAAASSVPASDAAAAAATAPYAGMYGFAWQGPVVPAAAAVSGQQGDVQAVFAALVPDADTQQQQVLRLQHVKSQGQLAATAAEGSCNGGQCLYGSPEQQLLLSGGLPNKKRCGYPGCTQQFDLRHLRALKQRHYCGRCQQAYCLAHTAYSPHGPSGGCGAESRCVCCNCFLDFTPEYRMFLASRNKLQPGASGRRSKSGLPQQDDSSNGIGSGSGASGGGSSSRHGSPVPAAAAAAADACTVCRDCVQTKSSPLLQQQIWPAAASKLRLSRSSNTLTRDPAAEAEAADASGDTGAACRRNSSNNNADEGGQAAHALQASQQHLKSRMLWARALTKSKAVVRLLHAGQQHNSASSSQQPQQAASMLHDS